MQQQPTQALNTAPSTPLNQVSTEQIQKYLDENKNLIMAILENQSMGKMAECAQYQAVLQKNLMYLAAIADAQPQGSTMPSQIPSNSVAPQGNNMLQTQPSTMQQQQGLPVQQQQGKLPFQLNAFRPQDQQSQMLQFHQQQQMAGHFGLGGSANSGLHMLMQPGLGTSSLMDARGSQQGAMEASGDGQGNPGLGPVESRE